MLKETVLFIGAHPDDIEIGVGGTVAKLAKQGYNVWWCILTAEADSTLARLRQNEVAQAALRLGLQADHLLYLGKTDGELTADRDTVAALRHLLTSAGVHPLLVFTHSEADSHNDHRAAAGLVLAAFRETTILHYGVVNSLVVSDFHPRLFVDTTSYATAKRYALEAHDSQATAGRLLWDRMRDAEARYAARIGTTVAEAFEVSIQQGAVQSTSLLRSINDCPFHAFWYTLIEERKLINIHGVPVYRRTKHYDWTSDKDREGMTRLRRAFTERWFGSLPLDEYNCGTERVDQFLYHNDVLLSGGAVSNTITRSYFNHIPGVRYVIDYDMPEYYNIRIWDRKAQKEIHATYMKDELGGLMPMIDYCIFTVMKNPMCEGRHIVGCMGIHGFGGFGGYLLMSEPHHLKEFLFQCPVPFPLGVKGYQALAQIEVRLQEVKWDWTTLHVIRSPA